MSKSSYFPHLAITSMIFFSYPISRCLIDVLDHKYHKEIFQKGEKMKISKMLIFRGFCPIFPSFIIFGRDFVENKKNSKNLLKYYLTFNIQTKKKILIQIEISKNVLLPMHCRGGPRSNFLSTFQKCIFGQ